MAWDSEAFRLQSQLRSLLLEDADTCIQAVAGLRPEEVERLELLVQLGKDFQSQPSSSGIVDAGLSPFSSLREISSLSLGDDPTSFGVQQPTAGTSGVSGDPQDSAVSQGEQGGTVNQNDQGNSNNGPPSPWRDGTQGFWDRRRHPLHSTAFLARTDRGEKRCERVTCSQVLFHIVLHMRLHSQAPIAQPSPHRTLGISCLQVWMH